MAWERPVTDDTLSEKAQVELFDAIHEVLGEFSKKPGIRPPEILNVLVSVLAAAFLSSLRPDTDKEGAVAYIMMSVYGKIESGFKLKEGINNGRTSTDVPEGE